MHIKKIYLLFSSLFCIFSSIESTSSLYHQVCPEILKLVNIQEPNETEQTLIHACIALPEHGIPAQAVHDNTWHAIKSIDMFSHILPMYQRTQTVSGSIALALQATDLTVDMVQLQQKTDRTLYLTNNSYLHNQLEQLIKQAGTAESFFFSLFRTISEEEQIELDKIYNKLYFHRFGLDTLNENRTALEIGPRLNQLHTLAWVIIPSSMKSAYHKKKLYYQTWKELEQKEFDLKLIMQGRGYFGSNTITSILNKEKEKIEQQLKENPNNLTIQLALQSCQEKEKTVKTYQDWSDSDLSKELSAVQDQIKKIVENNAPDINHFYQEMVKKIKAKENQGADLSEGEKNLLNAESKKQKTNPENIKVADIFDKALAIPQNTRSTLKFFTDPAMQILDNGIQAPTTVATQMILPYLKKLLEQGFFHFPKYAYDTITKAPENIAQGVYHHITQNPVYHNKKNTLAHFQWDPNAYSTKAIATTQTAISYSIDAALIAAYPLILLARYHATKNLMTLIHNKQKELILMGHWIKSLQAIHATIKQHTQLKKIMSNEYAMLSQLFDQKNNETSADLKQLISTLLSSSFQGSDSLLLSQQGKILATHHVLTRIKHELVPYFQIQGQIDAYCAIATLYKEFKNHPCVHFCLPTFVENPTPVVDIHEYWHPLINPNYVVTNDLSVGTQGIKNLMITGPNAGGKTTSLMSLIINIIFAQSFGIAPSSTLTITPFAKIHSYLDITTNLQEGLSLFAAEVDRAKKLKESILSCTPGQKTFTIIDEIFSGTNPTVASDVGFTFAAQLGDLEHSMTIITTHFPRLTDLEKEMATFTNYKVADAAIMPSGKIIYPFKLVPGISTQNIAAHMLEQQGII